MVDEVQTGARQQLSPLPHLDPFLGTLPPRQSPYRVTMADVHDLFVVRAPFRESRQLIYDALQVYSDRVWSILPNALIWIDGGFVTHKEWEAPEDVDLAIVVDEITTEDRRALVVQGLLTLANLSASIGDVVLPKFDRLRPMGGLVDAYLVTKTTKEIYRRQWSRVRGPDHEIMPDVMKGFVEVARGTS